MHADTWQDVALHALEWIQTFGWKPLSGLAVAILLGIGLSTGNWPGLVCARCRKRKSSGGER